MGFIIWREVFIEIESKGDTEDESDYISRDTWKCLYFLTKMTGKQLFFVFIINRNLLFYVGIDVTWNQRHYKKI